MATPYEAQLEWIQRNHTRKPRARSVGGLVTRLVDGLDNAARAAASSAAAAMSELVDDDFRAHCRLVIGKGNRLTVNVDHASLIYPMRSKWLSLLTRTLVTGRQVGGVRSVGFAYGRSGVALNERASK